MPKKATAAPKVNISPSKGWNIPTPAKKATPAPKAPAPATPKVRIGNAETAQAAKSIAAENKLNVYGVAGSTGKKKSARY